MRYFWGLGIDVELGFIVIFDTFVYDLDHKHSI